MKVSDVISAKSIAAVVEEPVSNSIPYLGSQLFPSEKKAGLDLAWIRRKGNLPVIINPAAFDTMAALRSREGFNLTETNMAYFKEGIIVKEKDEQELLRISEMNDPYLDDVVRDIFDDTTPLVEGARAVPERMRMQLIAPKNGKPVISCAGNGANYAYDYDSDGEFQSNNFVQLLGSSNWNDTEHSNPIGDLIEAKKKGSGVAAAIMNGNTMALLLANKKITTLLASLNPLYAYPSEDDVISLIKARVGIDVIVYDKKYVDYSGNTVTFYPDGVVTLVPLTALGRTWYGTTPEERAGNTAISQFSLVDNSIGVQLTMSTDPVQTKVIASEIVLPSFEHMMDIVVINIGENLGTLTGTVAEGTASGTTKVTLDAAPTGYSYKVSTTTTSLDGYYFGADFSSWADYTSADNITIADGNKFAIALVDSNGLASKAGIFTADTKA